MEELMPFLHNIMKEAKKGYYDDNPDFISGYVTAVEDILYRIEELGDDDATQ